ncbi:hypothetical protein LRF89_10615 [Halorhodospira sp. 9621]|uniref:hypothetical protein n=1 Tax=Halorhodospira TaxID=85108 RepID=UPI001EE82486|nr:MULTISPECIES: hypothetical protein [Halorhodospira]MCG5528023.1 hypothetical protein [Halorhodospira halophila]MCG5533888.1 hypothetical protein [Halorhodospira sp. 9621]MCG5542107.1 hypothetical protein [Halorhodospira sp. 9628]
MTEHERNQAPGPHHDANGPDHAAPSRGMSRRRFGQAALGSVPVLMTLYSNPLRASSGTPGNCHPSGWVSGNTSQHGEAEDCGGESPGHWGNHSPQGQGGGAGAAKSVDFNRAFGFADSEFTNSEGESLDLNYATSGRGKDIVERNFVEVTDKERKVIRFGSAAYMSRIDNKYTSDRPTREEIIDMVKAVLDGDYYQIPSTGDELTIDGVIAFLKNTQSGKQGFNKDSGLVNF